MDDNQLLMTMNEQPDVTRYVALIPAAGVGARMAAGSPKQYLPIGAKPMLRHTVDAFLSSPLIAHTYVVVSPDDPFIDTVLPDATDPATRVTVLRCGGATRMESIRNGLHAVRATLADTDHVLVHDAARPGLNAALIERLITETGDHPAGGLLALPVVDTVKRRARAAASRPWPRDDLWLAQTPQMFTLRTAVPRARRGDRPRSDHRRRQCGRSPRAGAQAGRRAPAQPESHAAIGHPHRRDVPGRRRLHLTKTRTHHHGTRILQSHSTVSHRHRL